MSWSTPELLTVDWTHTRTLSSNQSWRMNWTRFWNAHFHFFFFFFFFMLFLPPCPRQHWVPLIWLLKFLLCQYNFKRFLINHISVGPGGIPSHKTKDSRKKAIYWCFLHISYWHRAIVLNVHVDAGGCLIFLKMSLLIKINQDVLSPAASVSFALTWETRANVHVLTRTATVALALFWFV